MRERMKRQQLIGRYEHNYFRGWVVAAKRRGRRWAKYFSDKPDGRAAALRKARAFRDVLVAQLPAPTKVKRSYALNTTGEVGVARTKERTRSGGILCRYVASLPRRRPRKASFSVGLYGEQQAFKLAVEARRRRLAELGIRNHP